MIGKYLKKADSLVKDFFHGEGSLLVKILVGQALLILLLTFFCLTRDSSDTSEDSLASKSQAVVCDLFSYIFFQSIFMVFKCHVGLLMWLLGCHVEGEDQDAPGGEKIISSEDITVDDDSMKFLEAEAPLLLILLVGLVAILLILTLIGKSVTKKSEETILAINSKGDWEYGPSKKRESAVKF